MVYVEEKTNTHAQGVDLFMSFFPSFMQNIYSIPVVALFCCMAAGVLSFMALPTHNKWLQAAALFIMGIASILAAWFLFSLM